MKNKFLTIVGVVFMIFFWAHQCDKSYKDNVEKTNYQNSSGTQQSDIASCPKCGKSYNKSTWGEMCNTCWSSGRGLKSKGKYIIE